MHALAVHVPTAGWIAPFTSVSPFSRRAHPQRSGPRSEALDFLRDRLADRRQRLPGDLPALPPALLRRLKPLVAAALELDPGDPAELASARSRVSPLTFAVLSSEPMERVSWLRTVGPDEDEVVRAVHRVLDELERLSRRSPR